MAHGSARGRRVEIANLRRKSVDVSREDNRPMGRVGGLDVGVRTENFADDNCCVPSDLNCKTRSTFPNNSLQSAVIHNMT